MSIHCRKYCLEAIRLSERLVQLVQDAYIAGCDQGANLVFYGFIFDLSSRIRLEAGKRLEEMEAEESLKQSPSS